MTSPDTSPRDPGHAPDDATNQALGGRPTRRRFLLAGAATAGLVACARENAAGPTSPASSAPGVTSLAIGNDPTTTATTIATTTPATTPTPTTAPTNASTTEAPTSTGTSRSSTTGPTGPARFVTRGAEGTGSVALTFHTNGDLRLAQRMLDILGEHQARATNFVVGDWLDANPGWSRKLTDAGHELANHTYSHPTFTALSPAAMATEITRCRDVLARTSGGGSRYFRPSGTDDGLAPPNAAIMKAATDAGYSFVVGWDVDPFDYKDPGPASVTERVLGGVRAGSIVSLHFGHQGTADALPGILTGLAGRGLRPVTLSSLIT